MPLYEYECENGHRFEVIQKFSDPLVDICPTCGAVVHKLMSSPAIQFKGTGWYITDYAKKDSAPARSETKTDKGDSAKTESGKSDGGKSESGKSEGGKSDGGKDAKASSSDASSSDSKKDSK
jgi:putative FmdB family regulatory protein